MALFTLPAAENGDGFGPDIGADKSDLHRPAPCDFDRHRPFAEMASCFQHFIETLHAISQNMMVVQIAFAAMMSNS